MIKTTMNLATIFLDGVLVGLSSVDPDPHARITFSSTDIDLKCSPGSLTPEQNKKADHVIAKAERELSDQHQEMRDKLFRIYSAGVSRFRK
jgi:hypothetical protein